MAAGTVTVNYADVFRDRVLANTRYWLDRVTGPAVEAADLDQDREQLIRAVGFALDLEAAWPVARELVIALAPLMERRGQWENWSQLLERAVQAAQQAGDGDGDLTLTALLARLRQQQGRLNEAITYYRRNIRLARRLRHRFEEGRACTNLGFIWAELGRWQRAEVLCLHALDIFDRINSDHGRAHTENHLGLMYTRQGLWQKGRHHLDRACAIWQAMNDRHGLMRGLINLGVLLVDSGDPAAAFPYLHQALELARLTGETIEIANIYTNLGLAYRLSGDLYQAELYSRQAEDIFLEVSNLAKLSGVWQNLARTYLDQGNWAEARRRLEAALDTQRRLKDRYGETITLICFIEYELARGNPDQALAHWRSVAPLLDRQHNPEAHHFLQRLQARYPSILPGAAEPYDGHTITERGFDPGIPGTPG